MGGPAGPLTLRGPRPDSTTCFPGLSLPTCRDNSLTSKARHGAAATAERLAFNAAPGISPDQPEWQNDGHLLRLQTRRATGLAGFGREDDDKEGATVRVRPDSIRQTSRLQSYELGGVYVAYARTAPFLCQKKK